MFSMKDIAGAALGIAMIAGAGQVEAAAITGQLNMSGGVATLDAAAGNVVGVADANFLDFTPGGGGSGTFITIGEASGSFASVLNFSFGSIADFSIDPFVGPIADFWTVGGFTFTLDSIAITQQDASGLNIVGTGSVSGNGYDTTQGYWAFSTQIGGINVAWSATQTVPAPAALGLLGLGLVGLGAAARRRKA